MSQLLWLKVANMEEKKKKKETLLVLQHQNTLANAWLNIHAFLIQIVTSVLDAFTPFPSEMPFLWVIVAFASYFISHNNF